jgi:hypothetical protein
VFILKRVKIVCFDTVLDVLILNELGSQADGGLRRPLKRMSDPRNLQLLGMGLQWISLGKRATLLNQEILAE